MGLFGEIRNGVEPQKIATVPEPFGPSSPYNQRYIIQGRGYGEGGKAFLAGKKILQKKRTKRVLTKNVSSRTKKKRAV